MTREDLEVDAGVGGSPGDGEGRSRPQSLVRHRNVTKAAAALVVLALIGTAVAVVATRHGNGSTRVVISPGLQVPAAVVHLVAGPSGWHSGDYGNARLWVPPDWTIEYPDEGVCSAGTPLLVLGGQHPAGCGNGTPAATVVVTDLDAPPTPAVGNARLVNGYEVVGSSDAAASTATFAVPALGVSITTTGAVPPGVLASIGPSPRGVVLMRAPTAAVPAGWKQVTYEGVRFAVPSTWPIVDGQHAGYCGTPFGPIPHAYLGGHLGGLRGCPATLPGSLPAHDGVWAQPQVDASGASVEVRTRSGGVVNAMPPAQDSGPILDLWYHGVAIQLGIGPDPVVAGAVLGSLQFIRGSADTPTLGACIRTPPSSSMPTPERVKAAMVLELGDVTLDPPRADDQPVMTAAHAWAQFGRSGLFPGEQYRLLLTRYSSKFPAESNANGTATPEIHDVLAWVVYLAPLASNPPGCATWGITVFNARTGEPLGSAGYSEGP